MNPQNLRIGIGHDTHRLVDGGPLIIGGIEIEFDQHLDGHSDADVLLHAVTDAILGLAAAGDIGEMFPNTDAENKNRSSIEMLKLAHQHIRQQGFEVINLDCILFAERPKFSPHKKAIAEKIAQALELSPARVNVKAKTGEGVGEVGTGKCMQAQCIALGCVTATES